MSRLAGMFSESGVENPFVAGGSLAAVAAVTYYFVRRSDARADREHAECRAEIARLQMQHESLQEQCAEETARLHRELTTALIRIAALESRQ